MNNVLLLTHISGAIVGLIAGALSMILRKGSSLHRLTGNIFVIAMVLMTTSAAYLAIFHKPVRINVVAAGLTFYLVGTGWLAGRRRDGQTGVLDRIGLALAVMVGLLGVASGFEAVRSPNGMLDKFPAAGYFVFGIIALLHASKDVTMLVRGGVTGGKRIARHLWRISFAYLITAGSFYPGQARIFPKEWRETGLLHAPWVLTIAAIVFWLIRVKWTSRRSAGKLRVAPQPEYRAA